MKKRGWIILLVMILVVSLATTFAACAGKEGTEETGNASIAADYDYTLIESKINEIAGAEGVFIKLHVQTSATGETNQAFDIALGIKNDIYYFKDQESEYFYDFSSDVKAVTYSKEDGVWNKEETAYNAYVTKAQYLQVAKGASAGIIGYMGFYSSLSGDALKSTATIAGRACDKYTIKETAAASTYSLEVCIDKATGVCLKYAASGAVPNARASYSIECTEFNTSYTPALPTIGGDNNQGGNNNQGDGSQGSGEGGNGGLGEGGSGEGGSGQGGNGGEVNPGGEPTDQNRSVFVGKRFEAVSVSIPDNRALETQFEGAYLQLYADLNFECVSGLGCILGHYSAYGSTSGRAVLNPMKIYNDGFYDYESAESMEELEITLADGVYTLEFGIVLGDEYYAIEMELEETGEVQAHDNDVCPLDPNGYGIDTLYQVSHATWNGIFQGERLFDEIGNFTVEYSSNGQLFPLEGTFQYDYYKINDSDRIIYEQKTFEADEQGQYDFIAYYADGEGGWQNMGHAYFDLADWWDTYTGAIPAEFLKASYNSVSHNYYISQFRYTPAGQSQITITNFRAWFENNLLMRVEYTKDGATFTFVYSDYGDTEIDIPSTQGGETPGGETPGGENPGVDPGDDPNQGTDPGTDPPADAKVYISAKYPAETQGNFAERMKEFVDEDGFAFSIAMNNDSEVTTLTYKLMFDDEKFVVYADQDGKESVTEYLKDDEDYFYVYSFDGEAWSREKNAYADAEGNQTSTMQSAINDILGMLWINDNYRNMAFDSVGTRTGLDGRDVDFYDLETNLYSLTVVVDQETGAKFLLLMEDANGGLMMAQCVTSFKTSTEIPAHEVAPEEPAWDEIEYLSQYYQPEESTYFIEHFAIENDERIVYVYMITGMEEEPEGAPFTLAEAQEQFGNLCVSMTEAGGFAWAFDSENETIVVSQDDNPAFYMYIDDYDSENGIGILGDHCFIVTPKSFVFHEKWGVHVDDEIMYSYSLTEYAVENGENVCRAYFKESICTPPFTLEEAKDPNSEFVCVSFGTWEYDEASHTLVEIFEDKVSRVFSVADDGTLELMYDEICFVWTDLEGTSSAFAKEGDANIVLYFWESSEEDILAGVTEAPAQGGWRDSEKWEYDEEEHTLTYYIYDEDDWQVANSFTVNDDGTLMVLM